MADRRKRKPFAVPPELYFQCPGGFHPSGYTRLVNCCVPCDHCGAKRGEWCIPTHSRLKQPPWYNSNHCGRRSDFMRWKRFDKHNQEIVKKLKAQLLQQYISGWYAHNFSGVSVEVSL